MQECEVVAPWHLRIRPHHLAHCSVIVATAGCPGVEHHKRGGSSIFLLLAFCLHLHVQPSSQEHYSHYHVVYRLSCPVIKQVSYKYIYSQMEINVIVVFLLLKNTIKMMIDR